jgi:hypothetical protein
MSTTMEMKCSGCGAMNNGGSKFCEYCGAEFSINKEDSDIISQEVEMALNENEFYNVILTSLSQKFDKDVLGLIMMELEELAGDHGGEYSWGDSLPSMLAKATKGNNAEKLKIMSKVMMEL